MQHEKLHGIGNDDIKTFTYRKKWWEHWFKNSRFEGSDGDVVDFVYLNTSDEIEVNAFLSILLIVITR